MHGFDVTSLLALGETIRQRKLQGMTFDAVLASLEREGHTMTPAFIEQVGWQYGIGRSDRSFVDEHGNDQPEPLVSHDWLVPGDRS